MTLYIFDKDGTLCRSKSGQRFINSVEDQELIPGVKEMTELLHHQGHTLAIATNQGGVAFGIMPIEEVMLIVQHAAIQIRAAASLFCPYHPHGNIPYFQRDSLFRKPSPGMLFHLMALLGFDQSKTVYIGDRPEDQEAAERAQIRFQNANEFFERI